MSIVSSFSAAMSMCTYKPVFLKSLITSKDPFGDDSLVAKYLLDGDATDLLGNYDGTIYGDTTTDADGKFNYSMKFDGDGDFILVDLESDLTSFTISGFVKYIAESATNYHMLGSKNTSDDSGYVVFDTDSGQLQFEWNDFDSNLSDIYDIGNGDWYHIAAAYDGEIAKVYVNGKEVASVSNDSLKLSRYVAMAGDSTKDRYFEGSIDHVEIYNRALNPQEVEMLYLQQRYVKDPTTSISGLIAHYPLDGTAEDLTGNYDGTENGGLVYAETEMGIAGSFDGSDDYIKSNLQCSVDGFSFAAWVNTTYSDSTKIRLVDSGDGAYAGALNVLLADGTLTLRLGNNSDSEVDVLVKDVGLKDGLWHHVAFVSNSYNSHTLFIDGVEITNSTTEVTDVATSADFFIGTRSDIDFFFDGNMKDVRVYNRTLTQDEITTIYNYEKITRDIVIDRGLVVYYPLHTSSEDHWVNQLDGTDTDVTYDGTKATIAAGGSIDFGTADGFVKGYALKDEVLFQSTTESDFDSLDDCTLKEVRKYNRELNDAEIATIYG